MKESVRTDKKRTKKHSLTSPSARGTPDMTAFVLNISIDCREPLTLARFWSEVTGYTIDAEPTLDRVRLTRPDARGLKHLLFQRVADPTPGKTKIHIDLAAAQPDEEIERAVLLGATLVDDRDTEGLPTWRGGDDMRWVVLKDPEGNEFCLG